MGTLAIPLLGAAGEALVYVGTAAAAAMGGVLVSDEIKKRNRAKDQAKEIAKAIPQAPTRKACEKCPPDCGSLMARNWSMSEESAAYQARVTGFAPGTEWNFSGADFDGFKSSMCVLQEAKAKYDQFFNEGTGQPKFFFAFTGAKKIGLQARSQSAITLVNPPTLLIWYFMQTISYAYFSKSFRNIAPNIVTVWQP